MMEVQGLVGPEERSLIQSWDPEELRGYSIPGDLHHQQEGQGERGPGE